jgi:PAS domain S-box-containing protein
LRNGEVDAVVVSGADGDRVYTLKDEAYRLIVESMAEGVLTLTRDGLILFSNERFASILGIPLDRVIGSSMHDFIAAEDAFLLRALLAGRVRTQAEVRLKRGAAELAPALLSANTLFLEAAECICLIVTDLSDLRRAEEELNGLRQMLQLVLDHLPQRVFWKDREGRYLGCNKAFADDAGVPAAPDIVGKTVYDFSHWSAAADLYTADDRQVVETGVAKIGYEEPLVGADGGQRWLRSSKVPLPGSIGGVIGILGTYEDITESKRAEEKLQRYSVELAGTNEELRRFTQIVSHDLRAPLLNLKGFSTDLRYSIDTLRSSGEALLANLQEPERAAVAQALQETIPEDLSFIESSVTRMDHLTEVLLRLSRVGRREFHMEELDAVALLEETLRTLGHQIRSHNIAVKVGPLPLITSDRSAVEQIFGNLLDNAIKYLDPQRPGQIEVSAEETADAMVLHVRDNGRGIAEDDMDEVFAPFRRAGPQDVPGEGMGLAFVRALLLRLGGRIECHSQLGVGTTFSFMLPRVR